VAAEVLIGIAQARQSGIWRFGQVVLDERQVRMRVEAGTRDWIAGTMLALRRGRLPLGKACRS